MWHSHCQTRRCIRYLLLILIVVHYHPCTSPTCGSTWVRESFRYRSVFSQSWFVVSVDAGAMMRSCLSFVLQLLLSCTVVLFFAYLSAISLSAWWLSHAESALGHSLRFAYLTEYVAKCFDKADKFFEVPLSEDLSLAVSVPFLVLSALTALFTVKSCLKKQFDARLPASVPCRSGSSGVSHLWRHC